MLYREVPGLAIDCPYQFIGIFAILHWSNVYLLVSSPGYHHWLFISIITELISATVA